MFVHRFDRRVLVACAGAALIAMTAACGDGDTSTPPTSEPTSEQTSVTTTTTTAPSSAPPEHAPPTPTEKSIDPTGGNLFTPGVHAPAAPTVPPGQHPGLHGIP